eukprot:TRINITY_DN1532_c0_g1_i1.p1 TRINITY_DN1532_c0_g1~~TRINITY_DN1532_c0_g1_i1.p1  ORF type:complete len:214 (-),score=37.60 TRINITY_DN1532_c0_g1_i1:17-658(-)
MNLPQPEVSVPLEHVLMQRKSRREFSKIPISIQIISNILWVAYGLLDKNNLKHHTVPSAGALYPLELFVLISFDSELDSHSKFYETIPNGLYLYHPETHSLELFDMKQTDSYIQHELCKSALGQRSIDNAGMVITIVSNLPKMSCKYKTRAIQYSFIESGHLAQNIYLLLSSYEEIGCVEIGAFKDNDVLEVLELEEDKYLPLLMLAVGNIVK